MWPALSERLKTPDLKDNKCAQNVSTIITERGKLRSYFHRFKNMDDQTFLCKKSPQTARYLLWRCELLRRQRQVLRNSIMKVSGNWPVTNCNLTKVKGKGHPITGHEGPRGGVEV
jgi:hypothetical protein